MNRTLRRWVWIACLLLAYGMYLMTALEQASRPPSDGWSRQQTVARLEGLTAYGLRSTGGITAAADGDGMVLLYADSGRLYRVHLDAEGLPGAPETISESFPYPDRMSLVAQADAWDLTVLQDRSVSRQRLTETGLADRRPVGPQEARDLTVSGDRTAILTVEGIEIAAGSQQNVTIPGEFSHLRWTPGTTGPLAAVRQYEGVKQAVLLAADGKVQRVWPLSGDTRTSVSALVPYDGGVLAELKDSRTGSVRLMNCGADHDAAVEVMASDGDLNPVLLAEGQENQLYVTLAQRKGDDQTVWNVARFRWNAGKAEPLGFVTRTDAYSLPLAAWKTAGGDGLLTADLSGDAKTLAVSGNSAALVAKTAGIGRLELAEALPGTLLTLLPTLMVGLFPVVFIAGPVMAALFLLSVLRLRQAEASWRKVVAVALAGHLLLKLLFAFRWVLFNRSIPDMAAQLPGYLNSPGAMLLTVGAGALAAWVVAMPLSRDRMSGDFWSAYSHFAWADLSVFVLTVMPYYYAYAGMPVFYTP